MALSFALSSFAGPAGAREGHAERLAQAAPVEPGGARPSQPGPATFVAPGAELRVPPPAAAEPAIEDVAIDASGGEQAAAEVTIRAERGAHHAERSASDFRITRDVLVAAPRREGADVLMSAPGVYVGRGEGPAVAHSYMLRGFDAEHGQDIEFEVGGLPINLPSHIHGQGYADLGLLIADVISGLTASEGVHDPRQGDFAVAGSMQFSLGVQGPERGLTLRSGYGAFGSFRQVMVWAPPEAADETFGAAQYSSSDGFGQNRAAQSGTTIVQHRFGEGALSYRTIAILHAARSDLAGVLRRDDIDAGRVCFTCVYPLATAQAQNALANRFLAGVFADYAGEDESGGQAGVWLSYDNFRIQENFTGFLQESRTLERVGGRGDLIEQQNRTLSLGLTGRWRTAPLTPAAWARGTLEVGVDGRLDGIEQAQNLLDASVRNQTWDRRVDSSVRAVDLGLWGDLDWSLGPLVEARVGLRADLLSYDVDDRLGNFVPLVRPQESFIIGFRRSAMGLAAGPRSSIEVRALPWLELHAAYGEGYRSPQARVLEDGEEAPFSKVRSADIGVRLSDDPRLRLTLGGYYTRLSDDVAFDAGEGRLERIGATQRLGFVGHVLARPTAWSVGSLSVTYVDATLLEPPPPTAEEPQPPFVEGQNLPFVPPLVVRADLGVQRTLVADVAGRPLGGRFGAGFSWLSPRPLPFGDAAERVALLDASAGLSWGVLDVELEVFNVLDSEYAAVEYSFASDWDPSDGVRPRTPARHIAAGAPLSWFLSLGVTL